MSRLEELQKAVDETGAAWIGVYGAGAAADAWDAAYDAYCKARQELRDYKKEHGL